VYLDLSLSVEGALYDVVCSRRDTNADLPSVDLAYVDNITLEDCLNHYTKVERVSDYECDYCCGISDIDVNGPAAASDGAPGLFEACDIDNDFIARIYRQMERKAARDAFGRPDARKRLMLAQPGPVMCIHLQRRHFNPQLGRMGKLRVPVIFPLLLDVTQWIAEARQGLFDAGSGDCDRGKVCKEGAQYRRPLQAHQQQSAAFERMCFDAVRDGVINNASTVDIGHGLGIYLPFEPRIKTRHREPGALYSLAAVVLHHGTGVGGHYTAYRRANDGSGAWASVSDCTVTPVAVSEVLGIECRRSAYMLLYTRCADTGVTSLRDALPSPLQLSGAGLVG